MSKRKPTNVAGSVRQRLLNLSKEKGEDFTLTLVRYAAERFLYRLSASAHAEYFILKGALLRRSLMKAFHEECQRPLLVTSG